MLQQGDKTRDHWHALLRTHTHTRRGAVTHSCTRSDMIWEMHMDGKSAKTQTQDGGTISRQICAYAHAGFTLILKLCDFFCKKEKNK